MSGDEAQHSSSDQGDSIVKFDKSVFLTREMRSHTNEVQQIEGCTDRCSQETQRYVLYTLEG